MEKYPFISITGIYLNLLMRLLFIYLLRVFLLLLLFCRIRAMSKCDLDSPTSTSIIVRQRVAMYSLKRLYILTSNKNTNCRLFLEWLSHLVVAIARRQIQFALNCQFLLADGLESHGPKFWRLHLCTFRILCERAP